MQRRVWDDLKTGVCTNMLPVIFVQHKLYDVDLEGPTGITNLDDRGCAATNCRGLGLAEGEGWPGEGGAKESLALYPVRDWGNYFLLLGSVHAVCIKMFQPAIHLSRQSNACDISGHALTQRATECWIPPPSIPALTVTICEPSPP